MRMLFVCNRYPPDDRGGYPQLCHDVACGLRSRDHEVAVLTTRAKNGDLHQDTEPVIRTLRPEVDFQSRVPAYIQHLLQYRQWQRENTATLRGVLEDAAPDVVLFWPSESLSRSLLYLAEKKRSLTVAYYLAGYSPLEPTALERYWDTPARHPLKHWPKALARQILRIGRSLSAEEEQLKLEHVMCVSQYERHRAVRTGISEDSTCVVHNGINLLDFAFVGLPSERWTNGRLLHILYAGRLCWDKGAHTAVQAIAELVNQRQERRIRLTLLGTGPRDYLQYLDTLIVEAGLSEFVELHPWLPRSMMPDFMAQYDVLVLPTIREEALPRIVQEAMATGLVVMGTPTGGTPEILLAEETGLCFPPGDAQALALQIRRVMSDVQLSDKLASTAREHVATRFTIDHTIQRVEELLQTWIS